MKNNLEKLCEISEKTLSPVLTKAKWRRENDHWLRKSQMIAVRVLLTLKELGKNQSWLAEQLEVSPQQVSKIIKGKQNLTLETIGKLERVLGIGLLQVPEKEKFVVAKTIHFSHSKPIEKKKVNYMVTFSKTEEKPNSGRNLKLVA